MARVPSMQLETELVCLLVQPVTRMSKMCSFGILAGIGSSRVPRAPIWQIELEAHRQPASYGPGPLSAQRAAGSAPAAAPSSAS